MSGSSEIKVVSSYGEIVTYEEHCKRLAEYLEEIKRVAVELTKSNTSLSTFIQQLQLIFGGLLPKGEQCYYYFCLESKKRKRTIPPKDTWMSWVHFNENGYPVLAFDFFSIKESIRYHIVHEFFLPQLTRNMRYLRELVKGVLEDNFGWKYISYEKRGKCLEMTFHHKDIDIFWFILHIEIKVLIGVYADIENCLSSNKDRYLEGNLFIIDLEHGTPKPDEKYIDLLADFKKDFPEQRHHVWTYWGIGHWFSSHFRVLASSLNGILNIGIRETYLLGELLTDTSDYQDELIQELRILPPGDNVPHEALVERILTFCFRDEFSPFNLEAQVETEDKKKRRDFIIQNRRPKEEFWRDRKMRNGMEKILFDAKNYDHKIGYDEVASTISRYLLTPAFGNFMIIICRQGVKDYVELLQHYLRSEQVVLFLTDEDLIAMINAKRGGKSPTEIIANSYHDFTDKV